ncbi:hypothetical protein ACE14D_26500 [Streptomyces sp. Act-28]
MPEWSVVEPKGAAFGTPATAFGVRGATHVFDGRRDTRWFTGTPGAITPPRRPGPAGDTGWTGARTSGAVPSGKVL